MTRRASGFWSAAMLLLAAAPVLAQTAPTADGSPRMVLDRVVASVNDEALTLSEVQEEGQPVIRKILSNLILIWNPISESTQ